MRFSDLPAGTRRRVQNVTVVVIVAGILAADVAYVQPAAGQVR